MRLSRLCVVVLAVLAFASSRWLVSAQTAKGRTFAILVACGDYDKTQLKPVPFTVAEMKLFCDVLIASGIPAKNIVFLHDKTDEPRRFLPTRANVLEQFKLLMERLRPEDTVIVALSGHGVQFKGDKFGYFCPLDAKVAADCKERLVPMEGPEGLLTLLDRGTAGRKLLLVNACRNNPTSRLNLAAEKLQLRDDYAEEAPKGTVMVLACRKDQFSWFYPDDEKRVERRNRSLFMYHLTEAWKGSYAQGKKLTVDLVVSEVVERVEEDALRDFNHNQMPLVKRQFEGRWELPATAAVSGYDPTGGYRFAHFGKDGNVYAVVCVNDKKPRRYEAWVVDLRTGQKIAGPLAHQKEVSRAAFSADGTRVVTASLDKTAVVWDARTGKRIAGPLNHQDGVLRAAFSADGTCVVTASQDHTAVVWDARTGQKIADPLKHQFIVYHAAFSADGTHVVTASQDGTAVVWDARTGKRIAGPLNHQYSVLHAAFSADGTCVVTASLDKTAVVWDARTGKRIAGPLAHQDIVYNAVFSADGARVVTASLDKTAVVWDARTGRKIAGPLAHLAGVARAAFSADGTRVVTACADSTAVVWDARTGQKIAGPLNCQGLIIHPMFSADGTRVVTADSNGRAELWDATSGKKLGEASVE